MTDHNQRVLTGQQLRRTTGMIAVAFVLSGVLGVLRQAIIGARFGAGPELDAFYAAYRLPEMLFTLIAGGALGSAFIPVFARFQDDVDAGWRLASAVITLVTLGATTLAVLAAILAPWITANILVPDAPPAQQALTADLMRPMLSTVIIFGVSGLVMAILNASQHFLSPALAPSMNNLGLIVGALFLAPQLGVYGLAAGAVLGALLHLGIQLPALRSIRPTLRPLADLRAPGVAEVLRLMGPRVLGSAVVQINFVVNTALASSMTPGSFTALTVAFMLMFTVLGVLGQSVGTAVFPSLAALGARDDIDGFRRTLAGAMRDVLFMSLPASVGLIVLAVPLVATINQRGRWTADDTVAAAWALQFFAVGLAGFALQEVLARAFYALRDTITPVAIAVGGMLLNVALSLVLIRVIHGEQPMFGRPANPLTSLALWIPPPGQGPFGGLALANALATAVESAVLWLLLRHRVNGLYDRQVLGLALRALLASLAMGAVVLMIANWLSGLSPLVVLLVGSAVGVVIYEALALALRVPEARTMPMAFVRRFRRS